MQNVINVLARNGCVVKHEPGMFGKIAIKTPGRNDSAKTEDINEKET